MTIEWIFMRIRTQPLRLRSSFRVGLHTCFLSHSDVWIFRRVDGSSFSFTARVSDMYRRHCGMTYATGFVISGRESEMAMLQYSTTFIPSIFTGYEMLKHKA